MNNLPLRTFAFLLILSGSAIAQDVIPAEDESETPKIEGLFVQGIVGNSIISQGATAGVGFGYTTPYGGVGLSLSSGIGYLEFDSIDVADSLSLNAGLGGHVGYQFGRVRPRINVGFGFGYSDDTANDVSLTALTIGAGLGLDLIATDHLFFSLGLLGIDAFVAGNVDYGVGSGDLSGFDFGFLNSFGISYLF